jgi:hypothetical protein
MRHISVRAMTYLEAFSTSFSCFDRAAAGGMLASTMRINGSQITSLSTIYYYVNARWGSHHPLDVVGTVYGLRSDSGHLSKFRGIHVMLPSRSSRLPLEGQALPRGRVVRVKSRCLCLSQRRVTVQLSATLPTPVIPATVPPLSIIPTPPSLFLIALGILARQPGGRHLLGGVAIVTI